MLYSGNSNSLLYFSKNYYLLRYLGGNIATWNPIYLNTARIKMNCDLRTYKIRKNIYIVYIQVEFYNFCTLLKWLYDQGSELLWGTLRVWRKCYIFLHLSPTKFDENDHNFVSIQQHFKSRLLLKTKTKCQEAENSRISSEPCIWLN